jgi:hypothetical protein
MRSRPTRHPGVGDSSIASRRDHQRDDARDLALAVGILVDDATVTIENINWRLESGKEIETAILDGSGTRPRLSAFSFGG